MRSDVVIVLLLCATLLPVSTLPAYFFRHRIPSFRIILAWTFLSWFIVYVVALLLQVEVT